MRISVVLFATLTAALLPLHAQDRSNAGTGAAFYRVEFNIHDGSDAAAKAGRRFALLLDDSYRGTFHASSRVPVATGSSQSGMTPTQWSYMDTGMNIDCTVHDVGGKMVLHGTLDMSTIAKSEALPGTISVPSPTVRQTKMDLEAMMDLGKPTVVASIEDPESSRSLRVEVTITKGN